MLTISAGLDRGQVADREVPFAKVSEVRIEAGTATQVGNQPLSNVILEAGGSRSSAPSNCVVTSTAAMPSGSRSGCASASVCPRPAGLNRAKPWSSSLATA
jgi:hypothetical protein